MAFFSPYRTYLRTRLWLNPAQVWTLTEDQLLIVGMRRVFGYIEKISYRQKHRGNQPNPDVERLARHMAHALAPIIPPLPAHVRETMLCDGEAYQQAVRTAAHNLVNMAHRCALLAQATCRTPDIGLSLTYTMWTNVFSSIPSERVPDRVFDIITGTHRSFLPSQFRLNTDRYLARCIANMTAFKEAQPTAEVILFDDLRAKRKSA